MSIQISELDLEIEMGSIMTINHSYRMKSTPLVIDICTKQTTGVHCHRIVGVFQGFASFKHGLV